MSCVTCGRVGEHAEWCARIKKAIREAARNEPPRPWWPWWLEPYGIGGGGPGHRAPNGRQWERGKLNRTRGTTPL